MNPCGHEKILLIFSQGFLPVFKTTYIHEQLVSAVLVPPDDIPVISDICSR